MKPRRTVEYTPLREEDEDERILPLINIVFLLLIFFMLAGSFSQRPPFEIDPPGSQAPEARDEPQRILHVGQDGRLALGEHELQKDQLAAALSEQTGGPPARIWIKADAGLDANKLVSLLQILRTARVESVRLLTVQREQ